MAEIFGPPEDIKVPELNFSDMSKYQEECKQFIETLKDVLRLRNTAQEVGEVIRFPVADGYAEYMVAGLEPVELVHLPLMDAYQFQYAHLLGAKEVREEIQKQQAIRKLFENRDGVQNIQPG